jgi:hypothetical protein
LPQLLLTPEDSYSYCAELLQQQSSSFIQWLSVCLTYHFVVKVIGNQ